MNNNSYIVIIFIYSLRPAADLVAGAGYRLSGAGGVGPELLYIQSSSFTFSVDLYALRAATKTVLC